MVNPYESPVQELSQPKHVADPWERDKWIEKQVTYLLGCVATCVAAYWCCEYYKTQSVWMLGITRHTFPPIYLIPVAGVLVLLLSLIGIAVSVNAWIDCPTWPMRGVSLATGLFHLLPWLMLFFPPFARFLMQLVGFDAAPR
jgi:hypothetical protein